MPQDVALYYDELHRWTAKHKDFQVYSGLENDTIHRFLIDGETGAFSPDTIYKFIDPYVPTQSSLRGLDAGSGYGGTCFRCLRIHGGHWTGVTISPEQCTSAKAIAKARGLESQIDFQLQSYDAPLPDRYTIAIAIESLIHSADPNHTLVNLAAALDPGGRLIVVDDMPIDAVPDADQSFLAAFKRTWRCPVAPSAAGWIAAAAAAGLRMIGHHDLTHLMKPRAEPDLDLAFADISAQAAQKTDAGFARLWEAEIGGLHLERLQRRGTIRYAMLVFEVPLDQPAIVIRPSAAAT
jgi:SAM-dependent methyltransferase